MHHCNSANFKEYFTENMKALHLPVPTGIFDTYNSAIAIVVTMAETIKTLGSRATILELIQATTGLEKLKVAATLGAAFYLGAVIGSIFVANARLSFCQRINNSQLSLFIRKNNLEFEGWEKFYIHHPEIIHSNTVGRIAYKTKSINYQYYSFA